MLEVVVTVIWAILTVYCLWFFFGAKNYQPLTLDDLVIHWKIHKQKTNCNSKLIHSMIKRKDQIVGFKCECGYEYLQQKLITQRAHFLNHKMGAN